MTTLYEKPCDFGHYLQLHRKSKGMGLAEVSAITKIPVHRLKQLEAQDLANLPAPVFVKGFIQAYARAVGADLQDALQRFDFCCASRMPEPQEVVDDKVKSSGYWFHSLLAVVLLVALVSVTLLIAGSISKTMESTSNQIHEIQRNVEEPEAPVAIPESANAPVPEDHAGGAVEPASPVVDLPKDSSDSNAAGSLPDTVAAEPIAPSGNSKTDPILEVQPHAPDAAAETGEITTGVEAEPQPLMVLQIRAIEPTWLTVSSDEKPPVEMSLKPEEVVRFKASDHFKLLIGNAGGVFLTLDDQPLGVPGNSGQVKNLQLP